MHVDYLIVGQGLAGTVLAHQLLARKKKVIVVDQLNTNTSSRVAAGLFNPITGRRFLKTWNADVLFPFLHHYYKSLEELLNERFFFPTPIYRPFSSIEDQNDWLGKSTAPGYESFISKVVKGAGIKDVHNPFGGLMIKNGGFLDLPLMLSRSRELFSSLGILREEHFDDGKLAVNPHYVEYKDLVAGKTIFCRGFFDENNPCFNWLPFRPVKGEILFLKSEKEFDAVYNKSCFITPPNRGISKCGSTYDWKDLTTEATEKGRNTIITNLKALVNWNVEVEDHKAGIRPATLDRKPFIGLHPEHKTLAVFNGLGTKGVTLAPYYADQLVRFLEDDTKLDSEVNIERYYSLYYNSFSIEKNNR